MNISALQLFHQKKKKKKKEEDEANAIKCSIKQTFKDISLQKVGVKLERLVAVLDHMLVQLQLTVAEGPIAGNPTKHQSNQRTTQIIKPQNPNFNQ
jgi:hypothetical protein